MILMKMMKLLDIPAPISAVKVVLVIKVDITTKETQMGLFLVHLQDLISKYT